MINVHTKYAHYCHLLSTTNTLMGWLPATWDVCYSSPSLLLLLLYLPLLFFQNFFPNKKIYCLKCESLSANSYLNHSFTMESFKEPQVQLAASCEKKCCKLIIRKCFQCLLLCPVLLCMAVLNMAAHAYQFVYRF